MSRPIKFRAWLIGSQRMLENVGFDNTSESDAVVEYMQFTGLQDRNGKDIYEGDILQYVTEYGSRTAGNRRSVRWTNGTLNVRTTSHYEVIGNIYENPELLTEGREANV